MLLLKNPQFLTNRSLRIFDKIRYSYEYLILSKFRNDWVKNVDFLIKAYFWVSPVSPIPVCNIFCVCT